MTRSEGERVRLREHLRQMRTTCDALEIALRDNAPLGFELPQTVVQAALNIATTIARCDAYQRVEEGTVPP